MVKFSIRFQNSGYITHLSIKRIVLEFKVTLDLNGVALNHDQTVLRSVEALSLIELPPPLTLFTLFTLIVFTRSTLFTFSTLLIVQTAHITLCVVSLSLSTLP